MDRHKRFPNDRSRELQWVARAIGLPDNSVSSNGCYTMNFVTEEGSPSRVLVPSDFVGIVNAICQTIKYIVALLYGIRKAEGGYRQRGCMSQFNEFISIRIKYLQAHPSMAGIPNHLRFQQAIKDYRQFCVNPKSIEWETFPVTKYKFRDDEIHIGRKRRNTGPSLKFIVTKPGRLIF